MPITSNIADLPHPLEFDIIIAGGGAAGCVLAGRLASTVPNPPRILLLERGENHPEDPQVRRPAQCTLNLTTRANAHRLFTVYETEPEEALGGRKVLIPCAKVLGGGGSVNWMMYARGSKSDYDDWQTEGWHGDDLVPLLRKSETYTNPIHDPKPDPDIHGFSGPMHVSYGGGTGAPKHQSDKNINPPRTGSTVAEEFLEGAKKKGYPVVPDLQNLRTGTAFAHWAKWINPYTGQRADPATAYIYPHADKPNLTILCGQTVIRVLLDGDTATGVEFVTSSEPTTGAATAPPEVHTARARKLVILSSGTLSTPQILERSAIGDPSRLSAAGVQPPYHPLPGVGENLQDHTALFTPFRVKKSLATHEDYIRGDPEVHKQADADMALNGSGKHTSNGTDCGGRVRPTPAEVDRMGEMFQKVWRERYENRPDKPVLLICPYAGSVFPPMTSLPHWPDNIITGSAYLQYPLSRGSIHIVSSDYNKPPRLVGPYFKDPADVPPMVWGYKVLREIVRRMPSYLGEIAELHPPFSITSSAKCVMYPDLEGGVDEEECGREVPDIEYSLEDDRAIEKWLREKMQLTIWHQIGTCSMKAREKGGVVDRSLNVHGLKGLKVADLSICPSNVAANTYSTAVLIGEKAACIVAEELGLQMK